MLVKVFSNAPSAAVPGPRVAAVPNLHVHLVEAGRQHGEEAGDVRRRPLHRHALLSSHEHATAVALAPEVRTQDGENPTSCTREDKHCDPCLLMFEGRSVCHSSVKIIGRGWQLQMLRHCSRRSQLCCSDSLGLVRSEQTCKSTLHSSKTKLMSGNKRFPCTPLSSWWRRSRSDKTQASTFCSILRGKSSFRDRNINGRSVSFNF